MLLDAVVEAVVSESAGDPTVQMREDDRWRDSLDRLAHGVRQMAVTHPRLFPLISTHATEALWLRPPLRSVRWVDAVLMGLQDHHFRPTDAVDVYKHFCTFLLGHLLLVVAALGLEHDHELAAPANTDTDTDTDRRLASAQRERDAESTVELLDGDAPDAQEIVDGATSRPATVAEEPALAEIASGVSGALAADNQSGVVVSDIDLPVVTTVASTATLELSDYRYVEALAGLLAHDTAGADCRT